MILFETEIKIKLRDKERTKADLLQLGAHLESFMENTDIYYNMPDNCRDFSQTDEALRLRTTILKNPNTEGILEETHDLTYKGPKVKTAVKSKI